MVGFLDWIAVLLYIQEKFPAKRPVSYIQNLAVLIGFDFFCKAPNCERIIKSKGLDNFSVKPK